MLYKVHCVNLVMSNKKPCGEAPATKSSMLPWWEMAAASAWWSSRSCRKTRWGCRGGEECWRPCRAVGEAVMKLMMTSVKASHLIWPKGMLRCVEMWSTSYCVPSHCSGIKFSAGRMIGRFYCSRRAAGRVSSTQLHIRRPGSLTSRGQQCKSHWEKHLVLCAPQQKTSWVSSPPKDSAVL